MEEFELKGENGIITVGIEKTFDFPNKTCFKGGYECVVGIEIKVCSYLVKSSFYTSTGELFKFYEKLKICQSELNGVAEFDSYEKNLKLTVKYDSGKISIWGSYQENLAMDNKLEFDFNSDQSYFKNSVEQLERIFDKYGGMKGVKK
ncbi:MAG: WapI family immunity protein [Aquaticitalea sp.]